MVLQHMRIWIMSGSPVRNAAFRIAAAAIGMMVAACGGSNSSTTTPSTSQTFTTEIFTGSVAPPANGVLQSATNNFAVGQGGGQVSITLTSAVETLPDGSLFPTVAVGLGIGTPSGAACSLLTNGFTIAQAGSTAQLSGSVQAGNYCVQVSDVTNQLGPVAYAVAVTHP
jgi:hypothetical protein